MAAGDAVEKEGAVSEELDELTQTLRALSEAPSVERLSVQEVSDELDDLTETLTALSEAPSEEQLSLQQFSHDIRTPLSSVRGCLQLLDRRWDRMDEDRRRLLVETAARETERVVNIVARLDETRPAG